ncbi:MAG: PAS domain-containing protein, partial [Bacteroidota bacterium]
QAWYAGPRVAAVLSVTAERMAANRDGDPRTQVEAAERVLGPLAGTLKPLARRLIASRTEVADATRQVAALLQINPHYVLIATFDGEIIEANPAFYAATGLSSQVLRGGSVELLRDVFPLEPLLEWADRSDREGSSIGGIDYGLVDGEGRTLPVVVSLRAVTVRRRKAVLIQATDVAARKRLERQVAAFSDTLELMVDQRVSELDIGQSALHQVLDRAGVLLATFDGEGHTIRWNGAAETFSGRMLGDVTHIHQATAALGIPEFDRPTFISWFWGEASAPLVLSSTFELATGSTTRRIVWRIIQSSEAHRTLVGIEVPDTIETRSAPESEPSRQRPLAHEEPALFDEGPSPEAIAEEEAWIRRLASAGTDAFGGRGPMPSEDPPNGGSWIARGFGIGTEVPTGGDGQSL